MLKERLHWYFHAISNCILHPLSCYIPYKYCFLVFPCAFRFFGVLSGFLVLFGIYMDRIQAIFFIFNTNPRFPPFLLYVRCKSGVTFIRRSFRDDLTLTVLLRRGINYLTKVLIEGNCQ